MAGQNIKKVTVFEKVTLITETYFESLITKLS